MSDMLAAGAAFLSERATDTFATQVTYWRGSVSVTALATFGQFVFRTTDHQGRVKVERSDRDFILQSATLAAGGIPLPPRRGDRITWDGPNGAEDFEVMAPGNEPPYHYSDPFLNLVRVHTKRKAGS